MAEERIPKLSNMVTNHLKGYVEANGTGFESTQDCNQKATEDDRRYRKFDERMGGNTGCLIACTPTLGHPGISSCQQKCKPFCCKGTIVWRHTLWTSHHGGPQGSTQTVVLTTPFTAYTVGARDLGDSCGAANQVWGHCSAQFSVCGDKNVNSVRHCTCAFGHVHNGSSCYLPRELFRDRKSIVYLTTNTTHGSVVVNDTLETIAGVTFEKEIELLPRDSFLRLDVSQRNDSKYFLYSVSTLPAENGVFNFTVYATVRYTDENVKVSGIREICIKTTRVFPSSPLERGVFVIDGSPKGTVVYDLLTDVGNIEGLSLELLSETNDHLFTLADHLIVCNVPVDVYSLVREDNIGTTISLNVVSSGQTILILRVAVIVSHFENEVKENELPSVSLANYTKLMDHFRVNFIATDSSDQFVQPSDAGNFIQLRKKPDYENPLQRQLSFSLKIIFARDDSVQTTMQADVKVTDVNDEAPVFGKSDYQFYVYKGLDINTVIGFLDFTDADTDQDQLAFTILNTSLQYYFKDSGPPVEEALILRRRLSEFDANTTLKFNVTVSDGRNISPTPASVSITIISFIVEKKIVGESKNVSLPEDAGGSMTKAAGVMVTNFTLTNFTGYQLLTPSQYFTIDSQTGVIYTTSATIDRETLSQNPIIISGLGFPENDSCNFYGVGNATIYITDVNDNAPTIIQSFRSNVTIPENSAPGFAVMQISANDKDVGVNADLRYFLQPPADNSFEINRVTGVITVKNSTSLDREVKDMFRLTVIVRDGGDSLAPNDSKTDTVTVTVTLSDVNDNSPVFNLTVTDLQIYENGGAQTVLILSATDRDSGDNGKIRFGLLSGGFGYFEVNSFTGELRTTRSLDRESITNFTLTLLASDLGSGDLKDIAALIITVLDVNDNAPEFSVTDMGFYVANDVDEGTSCTNSPILHVSATDKDDGIINNEIVYSIESELLYIDNASGEIFCLSPGLDFETLATIEAVVIARDKVNSSMSGNVTVYVLLRDLNDNSPVFQGTPYNFTVGRQAASSVAGIVFASDRDSGMNGEVNYVISQDVTGLVTVNEQGVITVTSNLASSLQQYTFNVTALDRGNPPRSSQVTVQLTFLDDRFGGLFRQAEYIFDVVENTNYTQNAINSLTVADNAGNVLFSLENIFPDNRPGFRVDAAGAIFCNISLDRENISSSGIAYTIYVKAVSTTGTDYASVKVRVLDLNDNAPSFTLSQNQLRSSENAAIGSLIIVIFARDPDYEANGTVSFFFLTNTAPFVIDPDNGTVSVSGTLDREVTAEYTLVIEVRDNAVNPMSATTTLNIYLDDVDDNQPQFDSSRPVTFDLAESAKAGDSVGTVRATDADYGINGKVTYQVANPDYCPCLVDVDVELLDGVLIKLKGDQDLDFEMGKKTYECVINATSDFTHYSLLNVTITLTDVNDNSPVFDAIKTNISISRDAGPGEIVVDNLTATDADSEINSILTFDIEPSGQDDVSIEYFLITPTSGQISVRRALLDISVDVVTLKVIVKDGGQPQLNSSIEIYIQIEDENTRPQFDEYDYSLTVTEEAVPNVTLPVMTVSAFDYDEEGTKGPCNCNFSITDVSGSDAACTRYFSITAGSGEITQHGTADREITGNFIGCLLQATDNGQPPKTGTARLNVTVMDINDNVPRILQSDVTLQLNESACDSGDIIYWVSAVDEDGSPNNVLEYRIYQFPSEVAGINITTGEIYLTSSFCNQSSAQFGLIVTASDSSSSSNGLSISLTYTRPNSNRNSPTFTAASYQAELPYTSRVGTTVAVPGFAATDKDNDTITYSLLQGGPRDLFQLDSQTGVLRLQFKLNEETPTPINVTILAIDNGYTPRTSTATVFVSITKQIQETCRLVDDVTALEERARLMVIFRGLFIALVILLVIAILASVVFLYKWRTNSASGRSVEDNSEPLHSMFTLPSVQGASKDVGSRRPDTSGLPPEPPRRRGQRNTSDQEQSESGFGSDGYLTPTTSIQENSSLREEYGSRGYLPLLPLPDPGRKEQSPYLHAIDGAEQSQGAQADMCLQTIATPEQEHGRQSDSYLQAIAIPEQRRQSDSYLHAIDVPEGARKEQSYLQ